VPIHYNYWIYRVIVLNNLTTGLCAHAKDKGEATNIAAAVVIGSSLFLVVGCIISWTCVCRVLQLLEKRPRQTVSIKSH